MLPSRRAAGLLSLAVLLTSLSACTNGLNGKNLEQILAADPRLNENPVSFGASSDSTPQPEANAQLPPDFPKEIPLYPNANLTEEVTQPTPLGNGEPGANANQPKLTRWLTSDPSNSVQSFYQKEFQANNWEILRQPNNEQEGIFEARRNDLEVTVAIESGSTISSDRTAAPPPSQPVDRQNSAAGTEFTIVVRNTDVAAGQPSNAQAAVPPVGELATQPTPAPEANTPPVATTEDRSFTDIDKTPPQLRQYIEDLATLGVLPLAQAGSFKSNQSNTSTQFEPSKIITHREFAQWLFAANNQINANRPSLQIREASPTTQPAFQDVPRTDPDFSVIQGLAEAGLIPSPLSGESTAVTFRPDAPLTREQLMLWKVPLDTRQALPNASVDAAKQTWGFQDVSRIDPKALRAVLADFQNGEQSNIRRVFGYTTLFQPKKPVTRAEAAAALWFFGSSSEGISAREALQIKQQQNQPQPSAPPEPTSSSSASPVPQAQ